MRPGTALHPLRVAIVGGGPSGFYAAEALFAARLEVEVDMLERLPAPFGLVRYGVAPDHPKRKKVTNDFDQIASRRGFRYFGNIALGRDVTVEELEQRYHAVIVATGASYDRRLGIVGEDLPGVHSARSFVGWYNGQPDCHDLVFDLSQEVAVIVGHGSVALDVCRVLAKSADALCKTDIAKHALEALAESKVREIHLVGRRSVAQCKFTPSDLREIGAIPGWRPVVRSCDLELNCVSGLELGCKTQNDAARNLNLFEAYAACPNNGERPITFHFMTSPVTLKGRGRLETIKLERQRLVGDPFAQRAEPLGIFDELKAGLLFRSIGLRGTPLRGLPFDDALGFIPNDSGRVLEENGDVKRGWYVTGWIKREPSGVIDSNRYDSAETVARLIEDITRLQAPDAGRPTLEDLLAKRSKRSLSYGDWLRIASEEKRRGEAVGKAAEKFVVIEDIWRSLESRPA